MFSAVIYVAGVVIKFNLNERITQNIAGIQNGFRIVAKEPSIKCFVLMFLCGASFTPNPDPNVGLDTNSWNEDAVVRAWAPPPYDVGRYSSVYMASIVIQEQTL